MPIKMPGTCAIWPVRFLRLKRKDGAHFNRRQEHLLLETRQKSPEVPSFLDSVGMGDRYPVCVCGGGGSHPDFAQPQLCFPREAMAARAVFRRSDVPLLDRQVHPTAKTKGQEWRGMEVENHLVQQQKQPPGAPAVHLGQEAEPRVSEGDTPGRGYVQGTGLVCGTGFPTRDREFCTQGTTPRTCRSRSAGIPAVEMGHLG